MKQYVLIVVLIVGITLLVLPQKAHAQLGFGGYNILSIPCFLYASPVYAFLTYQVPVGASPPNLMIFNPLVVSATIWFSYYDPIIPTVPLLGTYIPLPEGCIVSTVFVGSGFHVLMVGSGLP
ncbi:MAG: hypothetical protein HY007_02680 [Candidatus Sungbacteria bacterium]|nr:hypothetical protein [Candidatus Sungbacteria bacterium]